EANRNHQGARHRHPHHLSGILKCGQCGWNMYITHARSSSGTVYPYFFCGGRSKKRTRCTMPATLIPLVESRVEDLYRAISITPAQRLRMEEDLGCRAGSSEPQPETDLSHTAAEVAVKREKILDAYYQDAITLHTLQV